MGDQNFHADGDENDASEEFGLQSTTDFTAEADAQQMARDAEQKRTDSDDNERHQQRGEAFVASHREGNADSEGVDARGKSQSHARQPARRFEMAGIVGLKGTANHSSTQENEQSEGNPMVVSLDVMGEKARCQPSDERHQGLEKAEKHALTKNDWEFRALPRRHHHATHDAHRETVHRQCHRQHHYVEKIHHFGGKGTKKFGHLFFFC